ncbi:hypothetical protein PRZ48_001384 [Zasmidium cellare]|uniref:Uncharacterized protein n=1 Tax=Zasmidium cellare TaxID=395010 RepID=A0ABR0F142_ZASCE|nr:hypothetical protein PRZ48_001384 [Zasmidium cellare]
MAGLAWSLLEFQGCFVLQLLSALLVILEPRLCSAAFLHSLSLMRGSTTYQVVTGLSRPIVSLIGQWLGYPNAYLLAYHFLELACTYLIVYLYAGPLDKPSEPTEAERLTAEIKNLRLKHSEELDVWAAKVCQRDEKITEVKAQVEEAKEETRLANEELYHLRDQRVQFGVNYQAAGEKLKDRQKKIDSAKKELQQLNLEIAEKTKQAVSHSSTTDPSHSHDGEKMPDVRQLGESKKAVKTFEFQSKPDPNISATAIALPSDEEGVLGGKRRVIPAVRPSTTMETRKAPNVLKPSILRSQAPGRQDLSNSNLDFEFVPFGKSAHPK